MIQKSNKNNSLTPRKIVAVTVGAALLAAAKVHAGSDAFAKTTGIASNTTYKAVPVALAPAPRGPQFDCTRDPGCAIGLQCANGAADSPYGFFHGGAHYDRESCQELHDQISAFTAACAPAGCIDSGFDSFSQNVTAELEASNGSTKRLKVAGASLLAAAIVAMGAHLYA